jgi:CubicO group peptidase (beta-lactamase class C family)
VSDGWTLVPPQGSGFAPDLDERLDEALLAGELTNLHGVVVLRGGQLALEHYVPGDDIAWGQPLGRVVFDAETLHDLRSVTKSVVGLLYGIALKRGIVPPPEAGLFESFPEFPELAAEPARSRITIAHVLTMTMGLEWDESRPYTDPANSEIAMDAAPDRYRFVLERRVVSEPGKTWLYNGGATALLGRLIALGSGRSLSEFAHDALFSPLGITRFEWARAWDGAPAAASGLRLRPRDTARIGQLMLQNGVWNERAIVPRSWLDAALQERVRIDDRTADTDPDPNTWYYGYHWYLGRAHEELPGQPWIGAFGNGGQQLWIVPGHELVVACTFGNYDHPDQRTAPERLLRAIFAAVEP